MRFCIQPARGSRLPWKHMHFPIYRKRPSFDWLCTPLLCPTTGFGVTTDCSKRPEKPSLSVVGCSGGDGFCDLAGGLFQRPSPRRSFHDHVRKYGRSSQVLEWFLSITQHWVAQSKGYRLTACSWFPSCWERDEEVEKGDGERKKKNRNGINRFPFRSMSATLASVSSTRVPILHHSNALS